MGTGPPGGSWHRMNPNLRTLSLSAWMSLPGLDFNTWCTKHPELANDNNNSEMIECGHGHCEQNDQICNKKSHELNWWQCFSHRNHVENGLCSKCDRDTATITHTKSHDLEVKLTNDNTIDTQIIRTPVPRRNLSVRRQVSREVQTRALVSQVAEYYESYVKEMSLERYFRNNTLVTAVKPFQSATNKNIRWLVKGIQSNGAPFSYACHNVVMANGASDLANHLGVNGENSNEWINHDLPALVSVLEKIPDTKRSGLLFKHLFRCFHSKIWNFFFLYLELNPVLIVGAGLSAADAVTICRSSGIKVIHVYRNRSAGLDKMLPETVYPEYHEVSAKERS